MRKNYIIAGFALSISVFFAAAGAHAYSVRASAVSTVGKGEVVDSALYASGSSVTVAGTVNGDVFCVGQNVDISGTINGDVFCAGQAVHISGKVNGSVRVAGQSVDISGANVTGSLTAAAQSASIDAATMIGRDASVFGQNLRIDSTIKRDLLTYAQTDSVGGVVGRTTDLAGQAITIKGAARLMGNVVYRSNNDAQIDPAAIITGTIDHKPAPMIKSKLSRTHDFASQVSMGLYWFLAMLVVGLAVWLIAPRWFDVATETITKRPWQSIGTGFIGLIGVPIGFIVLLITFIGIPLAFIILGLWIIVLALSLVFAGNALGEWIIKKGKWHGGRWLPLVRLGSGLLVLAILSVVPLIGGLVMFIALLWGAGAIVLAKLAYLRKAKAL